MTTGACLCARFDGIKNNVATTQNRARPSFFWQGVFIMLPVAVLAVVSFISLRQDERAAEADARKRAAEAVQSLAQTMRATVDEEFERFLTLQNDWFTQLHATGERGFLFDEFPAATLQADLSRWQGDYPNLSFMELALPSGKIAADGGQIEPPTFPLVPQPPRWFRELSPVQARLWEELREAQSPDEIERCESAFLKSKPSEKAREAVAWFPGPGHSMTPSESGLTFAEINCYSSLTDEHRWLTRDLLGELVECVIDHPSMASGRLLTAAAALTNAAAPSDAQRFGWIQYYFNARARVSERLGPIRQVPDLAPWHTNWWSRWSSDGEVLAVLRPATGLFQVTDDEDAPQPQQGYEVWFIPRTILAAIIEHALAANQFLVPPYAATEIDVNGARMHPIGQPATTDSSALLGESKQTVWKYFAQDAITLEVKSFLTSHEQMLAAEERRAKLFGALIAAAALTALAGLWSTRRAFQRQWQLNEQKSNFVSSVSHELRTPIASVRLMAENLAGGKVPEPARQGEYFCFIVQECRRLSSLIENVLDFSRIEQGRKQYDFEPTNLTALVETTVKLMEPYATEKGVVLKMQTSAIAPATPTTELNVDGRAIQQALVNLIDNAVKHSAKGQTVTVGLESWPDQAAGVTIHVTDHGPGIPAAEHGKIFERFYRLGSELRRETQGVGIGLSVVKHIVLAHGGHVRVESEVGQGSRFTIELPNKLNHE